MRFRKSQSGPAFAAIAAVLVLAVTMLVSRGVVDALLVIVVVAVLAGMYMLRRYARAVLLYRRPDTQHQRHPDGEPVSRTPAAVRAGGARERRVLDRT